MDLDTRIDKLIEAVKNNFQVYQKNMNYTIPSVVLSDIRPGSKYIKIFITTAFKDDLDDTRGWSVWMFIDKKNGNVYKPASVKAPAKGVRFNLMDDDSFADCCQRADWAGSFLYKR
jgi:hypothetical protein